MNNQERAENEREFILGRIKKALKDVSGGGSDQTSDTFGLSGENDTSSDLDQTALSEKFRLEFEQVGGIFFEADSERAAADYLSKLLIEKKLSRIVGWSAENLETAWVKQILNAESVEFYEDKTGNGINFPALCESADAGITRADFAIAETGTLVQLSGAGRSRSVSLLPPVHIALVKRGDFVFDLNVVFAKLDSSRISGFPPSAITFITGPSRTADIELKLVVGVHGSQEIYVIVY